LQVLLLLLLLLLRLLLLLFFCTPGNLVSLSFPHQCSLVLFSIIIITV